MVRSRTRHRAETASISRSEASVARTSSNISNTSDKLAVDSSSIESYIKIESRATPKERASLSRIAISSTSRTRRRRSRRILNRRIVRRASNEYLAIEKSRNKSRTWRPIVVRVSVREPK